MENTDKNDFNATIGNTVLCDGFLIPMTDFVIEYAPKFNPFGTDEQILCLDYIHNYAKFLKQPLKLEMFVPCDEDGNVLEEPINYNIWEELHYNNGKKEKGTIGFDEHLKYHKTKENVLFEGFEYVSETDETWLFKINGNFPRIVGKKLTIESLRIFQDKIKLSQTALNTIFG